MIKTVFTMITFHSEIPIKDRKLTFHKKKSVLKQVKYWVPYQDYPYLDINKSRIIYTSVLKTQLNYCPLVWMFFQRSSNSFINKFQERPLRIICYGQLTDFKTLLSKYNEIAIHQRNLQVLMWGIFKIINDIAPPIMS